MLGEHKGINAPGVTLPSAGLTAKDVEDLKFGVSIGVDFIALSFVQTAADLRQAREALRQAGAPDLPLVAKLERPEAVARLDEILDESDAVMVARGDLGLELPLERVPRVQKEITRRARALGIPVIVATQVLESMRTEPRPTRAEVSDAANAVDDGVDAIMLAGETAVGTYPVRAVQTLDAIIRDAETIPPIGHLPLEGRCARARRPRPRDLRGGGDAGGARRGDRHRRRDARRQDGAPAVGAAAARADLRGHRSRRRSRGAWRWRGASCRCSPICSGDVNEAANRIGDRARRARHAAALLRDRARQHHARPRARAVEFPEAAEAYRRAQASGLRRSGISAV